MSSFPGTTYTLEQYPDPSALIGGLATYPLSFPHPIMVVSQTQGTPPWPQTVQYTGSPISAMVYSPSNVTWDKNTLLPIDVLGEGKPIYNPTAGIPAAPALQYPVQEEPPPHMIPWWEYAVIGGVSIGVIGLLIWYALLRRR